MGIGSSMGITFGRMFKREQDYSLHDDTIVSSNANAVSPAITTCVHFYGKLSKLVALGGTFGINLPLVEKKSK